MKNALAVGVLALICTPFVATVAKAGYDDDDGRYQHKKIRATEMVALGLSAAAIVGGAGYLAFRQRARIS